MPVTMKKGHGNCTAKKEETFRGILAQHIEIVKRVLDKNSWAPNKYIYIDLYAGSGINEEEECDGSPVIFLKTINNRLSYEAHFIESGLHNYKTLSKEVAFSNSHTVYHNDNKNILPKILISISPKSYGLVYADPNGIANWELLSSVANSHRTLDILIHTPATAYKRAGQSLLDCLSKVDKRKWIIQEPIGQWQWTFLFGTNYTDYRAWLKYGMHDLTSEKGQSIYNKLCHTKSELIPIQSSFILEKNSIQMAIDRSKGMCEVCKINKYTEIHHLSYKPPINQNNMIAICHQCHCKMHGKEN